MYSIIKNKLVQKSGLIYFELYRTEHNVLNRVSSLIIMKDELTYTDQDNNTIYTSKYLRNRGSCCKTTCLHCPYDFTIKQLGLTFKPLNEADTAKANQLISNSRPNSSGISESLIAGAFGGAKVVKVSKYNLDKFKWVYLKGLRCGLLHLGKIQAKDLFLEEYFNEQGLTLELVESYL